MKVTLTTAQVITVASQQLMCDMGEVYEALNAITGDDLFTHQLLRAAEFARPHVIEACPWVTDLPPFPDFTRIGEGAPTKEVVETWVAGISKTVGETHEVPELSDRWEYIDPFVELAKMMAAPPSDAGKES